MRTELGYLIPESLDELSECLQTFEYCRMEDYMPYGAGHRDYVATIRGCSGLLYHDLLWDLEDDIFRADGVTSF